MWYWNIYANFVFSWWVYTIFWLCSSEFLEWAKSDVAKGKRRRRRPTAVLMSIERTGCCRAWSSEASLPFSLAIYASVVSWTRSPNGLKVYLLREKSERAHFRQPNQSHGRYFLLVSDFIVCHTHTRTHRLSVPVAVNEGIEGQSIIPATGEVHHVDLRMEIMDIRGPTRELPEWHLSLRCRRRRRRHHHTTSFVNFWHLHCSETIFFPSIIALTCYYTTEEGWKKGNEV